MVSKPYQRVPIQECGEPLVPIPLEQFAVVDPHPYAVLGAPYGERSPYYVRQGVLQALLQAQELLQTDHPGWRIQIFDAYRPIAVQQFMVDYTYGQLLQDWQKQHPGGSEAPKQELMDQVCQFWAAPSHDPATPPPHSTGAAVDITLVDDGQQVVDMGSEIDEISERSFPNYFADKPGGEQFHQARLILSQAMKSAGFQQHPNEWWHFSLGDQLWAWLEADKTKTARYGGAS
ncbi:M15 family metallopeptidase [Leptothoe kymatousa]|uniref:D-alanyl-D-alanine dipeptidase n=1 Tax=Leptothoe kymatousa TAU-MAC 1615 TaxID=2364775 RepID=A0ABS5Y6M2_9CYAN|nr:M15 family metallopeptidase [Leptothoe kymatousa]MBT9313478.1 M15 family metallopeptidase [Leptothoe kymatousa TAU-MAC 1615]